MYVQPFRAAIVAVCCSELSSGHFQKVEPTSSLLTIIKVVSQFGTVSDVDHWQAVSARPTAAFPPLMVELFVVLLFTGTPEPQSGPAGDSREPRTPHASRS